MQHYCKATNCKLIVASMPKLPEQNQYSKNVELFDKFIGLCCLFGLFNVNCIYRTIIISILNSNNNCPPIWVSWFF